MTQLSLHGETAQPGDVLCYCAHCLCWFLGSISEDRCEYCIGESSKRARFINELPRKPFGTETIGR